ncbi:major facilitator superfamily domain-containing protein [Colletotrichum navitas]|uniref:Major facilitator superfamily domain-containing protein n=1 Tax=Colletotrichum navitas TaxID=681940 RepID=A0AAD8PZX1_9PEZI|nr:major facilitator superfamily domain-containing protein [Colletotrichum navitas]KAK1590693.1 major facilitator superfamily domain-containing protein [Colletotrichum navitas]
MNLIDGREGDQKKEATLTLSVLTLARENSASEDLPPDPPCDSGIAAWSLLASLSLINTITWGFGSAFGVFREYYFKHKPMAGNQTVASIGVMNLGTVQIISPLLLWFLGGRPHQRKPMMWVGMALVSAASVGAAFSKTPLQLIMMQGLLYGIGGGLLFAPSISFLDEWFLERRGLANGLFFGSNNIAAAGFSPIFSLLLERFGPRTVLTAWAILAASVVSLCILLVRPRLTKYDETRAKVSWGPFKKPLFGIFALSMALQGLASHMPAAYLPSYATDVGMSTTQAALLISYLSLSGMVGQSLLGALTDAIGALVPLLLSTLMSTFALVILWGLGQAYWTMVLLSIIFGAFAFSFVVLRSHMAAAVVGDLDHPNDELVVSGALLSIRGVAAVTSGYIGAAVTASGEHLGIQPGFGAGKWRPLVITLSVLMFGATVGALGFLKKERRMIRVAKKDGESSQR